MSTTPVLSVNQLTVRYENIEALSNISFVVEPGDFIGVAGPNGAGKTTLIKTLLGLIPISSGSIILFGEPQATFTAWHNIGYLPQTLFSLNPLFPATVAEIVFLGLLTTKSAPRFFSKTDRVKVANTLDQLDIADLKDKQITQLSGGQQQRVMLARALVANPKLLIFDEPSTALDPASRTKFFKLLKTLSQQQGITIIMITHDTGYIGNYANKLLYLDRTLIHYGSMADFCAFNKTSAHFEKTDQHIIWHQHE
ncbi:MAG: metal ABC transporter ATP-binding protein [Patescibacteria group bacterium]|jgi:zinc transport system ATP-binding protein